MADKKTTLEGEPVATNDAYTGMLGISLLALIGGCILLYLDYSQYPDKPPAAPPKAPPIIQPGAKEVQPQPKEEPKGAPKDKGKEK